MHIGANGEGYIADPATLDVPGKSAPDGFSGRILVGDARQQLPTLPDACIDLSFWSPPYFVGKSYEKHLAFEDWRSMMQEVIHLHLRLIKPGGFLVVNIGDILCYPDPDMPRFQADNIQRKQVPITKEQILAVQRKHPGAGRKRIAAIMGCSEQTIHRRIAGNNVRGGRQAPATRVLLTGALLTRWAEESGFYLYDRRIWHKDPCWNTSRWHSNSYRSVDEFEHLYIFWKPGVTEYDRHRLEAKEWSAWGSRGVWSIPSVRQNIRHEAEFPEELASRVIRLLSPRNGVVLDAFVGSGTTTSVARQLGRRWVGIESDPTTAKLALQRTLGGELTS